MARYLALDWDQNQLHIIAADIRGKDVRVQKAVSWPEAQVPNPAETEALGKLLRERLKEAGIAPAPVLACVGRDRLIVKDIKFPPVPVSEEPAVVRFQTVKELTDAPDDVVIDYMVTGNANGTVGERRAASLVIRREVLKTYQGICQAAGLKLAGLTPRLVGISACLRKVMGTTVVTPPPEPADGLIAVAVAHEKTTEFAILRGEAFLLTRSLAGTSNPVGDIRRNLAVYAGQNPGNAVVAVYVAGKGAAELRERLGEMTDLPVHTFDPFAGSELPTLPSGNRGSFSGAMGLLYAKAAGELPINFASPRQPKPPSNPNYKLGVLAAAAVLLLLIAGIVGARVAMAYQISKAQEMELARLKVEKTLTAARENAKRLKSVDEWDTMVMLDELYEMTARIPDVNALRITSIKIDPLANAKSAYQARITISGKVLDRRQPRAALDKLISRFNKEDYYNPRVDGKQLIDENNNFNLVVDARRRAPEEYRNQIPDDYKTAKAPPPSEEKDADTAEADTKGDTRKAEKGGKMNKGGGVRQRGGNAGGKRGKRGGAAEN